MLLKHTNERKAFGIVFISTALENESLHYTQSVNHDIFQYLDPHELIQQNSQILNLYSGF